MRVSDNSVEPGRTRKQDRELKQQSEQQQHPQEALRRLVSICPVGCLPPNTTLKMCHLEAYRNVERSWVVPTALICFRETATTVPVL